MQTKFTPGPWHRNIKPARRYPTVWAGRNTHVAAVVAGAPHRSGNGGGMSDEELEANIDLIAAAPTMAEALEQIAIYGCGMLNQPAAMNGPEEEWLRKRIAEYERVAHAALRAARGEQGEG